MRRTKHTGGLFEHLNRILGDPDTTRGQRDRTKRDLMAVDPHCHNCRRELTDVPLLVNSIHLVNEVLTCRDCETPTRLAASEARYDERVTLTPKGQAYLDDHRPARSRFKDDRKRKNLKAELMAINPTCSQCGLILDPGHGEKTSAHLVLDRLSCPKHIKAARAAGRLTAMEYRVG